MAQSISQSSADRQARGRKAAETRARNQRESRVEAAMLDAAERPQRKASRKALATRIWNGNAPKGKNTTNTKRPASPSGDVSAPKRPRRNANNNENTSSQASSGGPERDRRSLHLHQEDLPPLPSDNDDDDDDYDDEEDGDDDERARNDNSDEDAEEVGGHEDDDDDDAPGMNAVMIGSDSEDNEEQAEIVSVVQSPEAHAQMGHAMSARERARRCEEPMFSDDEDDNEADGHVHNGGNGNGDNSSNQTLPTPQPPLPNTAAIPAPQPLPAAAGVGAAPTGPPLPPVPANPIAPPQGVPAPGYDPSTWLVPPTTGQQGLQLKSQTAETQSLLRRGFRNAQQHALFNKAFLDPAEVSLSNKQRLLEAAVTLHADAHHARLVGDATYSPQFDRMINNRVAIMRGHFKRAADNKVVGFYRLPNGEAATDVIRRLLDRAAFHYAEKDDGTADGARPYAHPCIISAIQDVVFCGSGRRSLAKKYAEEFVAISNLGEPELPIAMVALAATAVCAALEERLLGTHNKKDIDFSIDTAGAIYEDHARALSTILATKPAAYHRLMADLYKLASGAKKRTTGAGTSTAMALLDIDAMAV